MLLKHTTCTKEPRNSALIRTISQVRLETLLELLDAIRSRETEHPAQRGISQKSNLATMLATTAEHISRMVGRPANEIFIRDLPDMKPRLRLHLKERRFKRNSIRSYVNFLRILVAKARELGWSDTCSELELAWEGIRNVMPGRCGCTSIICYAIRNERKPSQFADQDLAAWREAALSDGRSETYLTIVMRRFRKAIHDAGLASMVPNLGFRSSDDVFYGVPVTRLPLPLRTEVLELLKWKTAEIAPGRPRKAKNRPVSAKALQWAIGRIAGFCMKQEGKLPASLSELLSRPVVTAYAFWAINQRGVRGRTIFTDLGRICALKSYPPFASCDFAWALDLLAQLPLEDYTERRLCGVLQPN